MSRGPRGAAAGILALAALAALAALTALAAPAGAADAELERLLAESDPFARAPAELRCTVEVERPGGAAMRFEIWRQGEESALVRFLAPRDRGKFILRRGRDLYFLSPGSSRAVRLAPALAPPASTLLDRLLGLALARDYAIAAATPSAGQVRFDLEARPGGAGPPRLRWVVDRASRRPLRAELLDASGRVVELVEFKRWRAGHRLEPELLVAKDLVRGGAPMEIRLLRLEERPAPEGLFDLERGEARAQLPAPEGEP